MKRFAIIAALFAITATSVPAVAQSTVNVRGHVKKDGTYVPPHQRTAPNSTRDDNWTTRGNVNPNTGEIGTRHGGPNTRSGPKPTYEPYRPYNPRKPN